VSEPNDQAPASDPASAAPASESRSAVPASGSKSTAAVPDPADPADPADPTGSTGVTAGPASRPSPLARVENIALAVALCGIAVVVLLQIGSRFILGEPLSWSTEAATNFLIWSAFLGFAVAVRERGHVALTIVEDHLSGAVLYVVRMAQLVVFAFLLGALTYGGAQMVVSEFGAVSAAGIPRWTVFAAVPVGAGLGLVHILGQASRLRRDDGPKGPGKGKGTDRAGHGAGRSTETLEGAL
jgi:TRAP-type C4-dicarboxylate transport system permease small subunit